MNEHPLPMFDEQPAQSEPAPPKKPKPKPTRKRRSPVKAKNLPIPKRASIKRRKRRVARQSKPETHHGGRYSPEVYNLIGRLMNLELPLRNFVIEVTKGLSK